MPLLNQKQVLVTQELKKTQQEAEISAFFQLSNKRSSLSLEVLPLNFPDFSYVFIKKSLEGSELSSNMIYPGNCIETSVPHILKINSNNSDNKIFNKNRLLLKNEIVILDSLKPHKNIIEMTKYRVSEEECFMIMPQKREDFCDFLTKNNFKNHKKMSFNKDLKQKEKIIRTFTRDIVNSVKHIHDQNICHLDLKFENILMNDDYSLVLADFGLASKNMNNEQNALYLKSKRGTEPFICPEMDVTDYLDGEKCDVFSIGVMLFALVFGTLPFSTIGDKYYKLISNDLWEKMFEKRSIKLAQMCSDSLLQLIKWMMYERPEERCSIDEVLDSEWMKEDTIQDLRNFF